MKTTVDIPENLLKEAMGYSKATTKRQTVVVALEEYTRRRRAREVVAKFGTLKNLLSQKELREMRSARQRRLDARWHGSH